MKQINLVLNGSMQAHKFELCILIVWNIPFNRGLEFVDNQYYLYYRSNRQAVTYNCVSYYLPGLMLYRIETKQECMRGVISNAR